MHIAKKVEDIGFYAGLVGKNFQSITMLDVLKHLYLQNN
jgi:hypothetical protein